MLLRLATQREVQVGVRELEVHSSRRGSMAAGQYPVYLYGVFTSTAQFGTLDGLNLNEFDVVEEAIVRIRELHSGQ